MDLLVIIREDHPIHQNRVLAEIENFDPLRSTAIRADHDLRDHQIPSNRRASSRAVQQTTGRAITDLPRIHHAIPAGWQLAIRATGIRLLIIILRSIIALLPLLEESVPAEARSTESAIGFAAVAGGDIPIIALLSALDDLLGLRVRPEGGG